MRGRDILKLLLYVPFLVYAYFSFTGKLLFDYNVLYYIVIPIAAVLILLVTRKMWFLFLSLTAVNLAVQFTGGSSSQLFFFYFLLLFVEGFRTSHWRYISSALIILALEMGSAVFHLETTPFPFGTLGAFLAFAAIVYLFLRREKAQTDVLAATLQKEKAKYHPIDPLSGDRSERLTALKHESFSVDADAIYTGYAEFTYATLEVNTVSIFLIDGNQLQSVAVCSRSEKVKSNVSFALGEGLVGYLARQAKPSLLNDLGEDARRLGYYRGEVTVQSLASAPIKNDQITYGLIVIDANRRLTEFDQGFLISLASLIARDIELAAAYEERHREALRFSGLYEMAGNLLTGITEDELIDRSFNIVRDLFAPDAIGFARLSEDQKDKLPQGKLVCYEGGNDFDKGFHFEPERSLVAMAAKHSGALKNRDMTRPGLYRMGQGEKTPENRTFLAISFEEDDKTRGVLWLEKYEADAYSEREAKILGFAATLLSAAFLRVRYQEQLKMLARLDGLTGLFNHRAFQEELAQAINTYPTVGLFIIDLDHFKRINDTYGHPVGDMVLVKTAETISGKGIAARYGGEEFALISPDSTYREMIGRGEEVLAAIRRAQVRIREGTVQFTASVGGAFYPQDCRTREDLVRAADAALYLAKSEGRDRLFLAGDRDQS